MKTTFTIQCRTCQCTKQSQYCDVCGHETRSHHYVENITEDFIRGLWHELLPFRYKVKKDGDIWGIESYGSDETGVFIALFKGDEIIKIYPKEK